MPSSASTQLNSTSTQTNAEVSFILGQIQPLPHPPRIVVKGDVSVSRLNLGQFIKGYLRTVSNVNKYKVLIDAYIQILKVKETE